MDYPHVAVETPASASKLMVKSAPGFLIAASGIQFSAGVGFLNVYDTSAPLADSAATSPIASMPLVPVGTLAVGQASFDFSNVPLRFTRGCFIALSSAATSFSLNTTGVTGYIMAMFE